MKKFENADVFEIELAATAYGPDNKEIPDSVKTAVYENGEITGWKQEFGENNASGGEQ